MVPVRQKIMKGNHREQTSRVQALACMEGESLLAGVGTLDVCFYEGVAHDFKFFEPSITQEKSKIKVLPKV